MKLNFKKYGNAEQAVVIVHGLFGMLDNWHNIAKKLSDEFTVLTVDVRNHGNSPHSDVINYPTVADDLLELVEDQGLSHAHFVGHSMGGKAVMELSNIHPHIIDKLVVVDIAPKRYKPGHLDLFEAMFSLPVEELSSRSEADEALKTKIPTDGIRLFLLKNLQRNPEGGYQWKVNLKAIRANYDDIIGDVQLNWPFVNDVLFIRGEKSNYIKDSDLDEIYEYFPNADLVTIPNAGHWVHAENPTQFVDALEDFLNA